VLTRRRLPDCLKQGELDVVIPERWPEDQVQRWAAKQYWFQTFPFSPKPRADSQLVWDKINVVDWRGQIVYDVGCHYGFFSFEASKLGAAVQGFDNNRSSLVMAKTIRDHIVMQDVNFSYRNSVDFSPNCCDTMLYLSVHHQVDPTYERLLETVDTLKRAIRENLFVELIVPPTFPKSSRLTERDIDDIMDCAVLHRYRHAVRGTRKIYRWEAKS
jgi:hypothetical protein